MVAGETRIVSDLHKSMKKQAPVKQLWKKARKDDEDTVKGLGGVVSSAGSLGNDKTMKAMFRSYKRENCSSVMKEATELFIGCIFEGDNLRLKLGKYLNRFVKGIDNVAKMIPEFIRADRQLIENIKNQMSGAKENLSDKYPTLLRHASMLQGQIDLFYMYSIMDQDYRLRDLEYGRGDIVGSGSFADVYRGTLKTHHAVTVALKISKDPVKEINITDILLEDRTLRYCNQLQIIFT